MKLETASFYDKFASNLKKQKSFTFTGLTTFSRLLLVRYIQKLSGKKILLLTSTEQSAQRYSSDMSGIFDINCEILTYQNISPYETLNPNLYDYQKQLSCLLSKPDIVICPIKALTEKFPNESFFTNNSFSLRIGECIEQKELLKRLTNLGYKRSTMVSDIGEFSIRGDIADIYTLEENPVRIEFWGDEIVDIRYFNNETQKSIEKIESTCIKPIYKFILPKVPPKEFSENLKECFLSE